MKRMFSSALALLSALLLLFPSGCSLARADGGAPDDLSGAMSETAGSQMPVADRMIGVFLASDQKELPRDGLAADAESFEFPCGGFRLFAPTVCGEAPEDSYVTTVSDSVFCNVKVSYGSIIGEDGSKTQSVAISADLYPLSAETVWIYNVFQTAEGEVYLKSADGIGSLLSGSPVYTHRQSEGFEIELSFIPRGEAVSLSLMRFDAEGGLLSSESFGGGLPAFGQSFSFGEDTAFIAAKTVFASGESEYEVINRGCGSFSAYFSDGTGFSSERVIMID